MSYKPGSGDGPSAPSAPPDWGDLTGKPVSYPPSSHSHQANEAQAFPVGSVFLSVVNTNPNSLLGYGTWAAIAAGRMLVGFNASDVDFNAAEKTGGAKTHQHLYTEVPNHTHPVNISDSGHTHLTQRYPTATGASTGFTIDTSMSGALADNTLPTKTATTGITATTSNPGGGVAQGTTQAGSSLPPYFTVYCWKRTA